MIRKICVKFIGYLIIFVLLVLPITDMKDLDGASEYLSRELAYDIKRKAEVSVVGVFEGSKKQALPNDSLSEDLVQDLSRFGKNKFGVGDRKFLPEAMQELQLQWHDLYDDSLAARVGKVKNAHVIVVGSLKHEWWGVFKEIKIRAVDVQTVRIVGQAEIRWVTKTWFLYVCRGIVAIQLFALLWQSYCLISELCKAYMKHKAKVEEKETISRLKAFISSKSK